MIHATAGKLASELARDLQARDLAAAARDLDVLDALAAARDRANALAHGLRGRDSHVDGIAAVSDLAAALVEIRSVAEAYVAVDRVPAEALRDAVVRARATKVQADRAAEALAAEARAAEARVPEIRASRAAELRTARVRGTGDFLNEVRAARDRADASAAAARAAATRAAEARATLELAEIQAAALPANVDAPRVQALARALTYASARAEDLLAILSGAKDQRGNIDAVRDIQPDRAAAKVLDAVTRILPAAHRSRYAEEFRAELKDQAELPRRRQLVYALRLFDRAWELRAELRQPASVSAGDR